MTTGKHKTVISIDDNTRVELLKLIYEEICNEMMNHKNLAVKTFFGYVGLTFIIIGFVSNMENLSLLQRSLFAAIFLFLGLFVYYIINLVFKAYKTDVEVINRVEKSIGCFEKDFYLEDESLFPEMWYDAGSNNWTEPVMQAITYGCLGTTFLSIVFIFII